MAKNPFHLNPKTIKTIFLMSISLRSESSVVSGCDIDEKLFTGYIMVLPMSE